MNISVTSTVKRNAKGFYVDVVIVEIGGVAFETRANSPEHARELMERTLKALNLWQTTSAI